MEFILQEMMRKKQKGTRPTTDEPPTMENIKYWLGVVASEMGKISPFHHQEDGLIGKKGLSPDEIHETIIGVSQFAQDRDIPCSPYTIEN